MTNEDRHKTPWLCLLLFRALSRSKSAARVSKYHLPHPERKGGGDERDGDDVTRECEASSHDLTIQMRIRCI
ncbi:hypothetical protein TNCV_4079311 [Trichonephila clavipes]|nr:hypothetical protein TNCV_4079311 [Trichonephila clavipes]